MHLLSLCWCLSPLELVNWWKKDFSFAPPPFPLSAPFRSINIVDHRQNRHIHSFILVIRTTCLHTTSPVQFSICHNNGSIHRSQASVQVHPTVPEEDAILWRRRRPARTPQLRRHRGQDHLCAPIQAMDHGATPTTRRPTGKTEASGSCCSCSGPQLEAETISTAAAVAPTPSEATTRTLSCRVSA